MINSSAFSVVLASCWRSTLVAVSKPDPRCGLVQFLWRKCLLWLVIVEWGELMVTEGQQRPALERIPGKQLFT